MRIEPTGDIAVRKLVGHLRWKESRCQRIDAYAFASRPLHGKIAGQSNETGLARRVRGLRQATTRQRGDARHVHDRTARLHDSTTGLRHPVAPVQIDVNDFAELLWRLTCRRECGALTRVVDEDVDLTKLLDRRVDHDLRILRSSDIGRDDESAPTALFHESTSRRQAIGAPTGQDDVCSGVGESAREGDTKS